MTAFSEIYDKFYELVETDSNFFQYFDLSENEVRDLVHDRAKKLFDGVTFCDYQKH